ncbi:hypothetical protein B0H14DRAFT_3643049 [Mycena olivaceomarginata]|nr:hypothetical protein B0H14DRAFT_3643049 [Mycena olivaceomarginata]
MDWIWSEYTTSPDPAAGMQSLNQTCSALTKHVLLPTHIVLSRGSFSLRPDLAQILINVVPQLGHFLNLAQRDAGLSGIHDFCHAELQVLISSTGSDIATQNQVVWNWVHLIDKVYIAMVDMKSLWRGRPIHILGRVRPSQMPWILAALPSALRVKLPSSFLRSHGISEDPPAVVAAARRNTAAREHVQCRSRMAALTSSMAAGGLAKASTVTHASGAAKTISPVTMDTVMADAPRVPTSCTVGASDAKPQRGQDRARSPPRGKSIPSFEVSMANLALEYTAGPDSVSQRVKFIAGKKILDGVDIVDRSDYSGSPYVGRFGLEADLLVRTEKAIADMESLLTRASTLAGRSSLFIIDPCREAIHTLRGTAGLSLLHVVWDGLVERMQIAQDAFELYGLGQHAPDPVRQACNAATHRRMQALDKERARRAAEAGTHREISPVTHAAAVAVSLTERLPLPRAAPALSAVEPNQTPLHPIAQAVSSTTDLRTSGHAPIPAVKDPPSARVPITTESVQASSYLLARAVSIQDTRSSGHALAPALPAVKDPPSVSYSAVDIVATTTEALTPATDRTGNPHVDTTLENPRVTALVNRFEAMSPHARLPAPAVFPSSTSAAPTSPKLPSAGALTTVPGQSFASEIQSRLSCIIAEPEVEFGGQTEGQTGIYSTGSAEYSVMIPSSAPVLAAGARTVELGGQADAPMPVELDSILEAETRTSRPLDDTNSDSRQRPSRMYYILAVLSPSLLVKLPADFLQSHDISIANARDAVRQMAKVHKRERVRRAAAARTPSGTHEPVRAAAVVESPPERCPPLSAARIRISGSTETIGHAPDPAVPAAEKNPPLQSPCTPLHAVEHESVALVAAIDGTMVELGEPSDSDTTRAVDPLRLEDVVTAIDQQRNVSKQEIRTSDPLGQSSSVLLQACLHECAAPSIVELGGLDAASPHETIDSRKVDSETDEQWVGWKGEETRTLVRSKRTRSYALAHPSRPASSLSPISSFSPSPAVLSSVFSPFSPLVTSSILDYLDFVSTILRISCMSYLAGTIREDVALCHAWAREGIGTFAWN